MTDIQPSFNVDNPLLRLVIKDAVERVYDERAAQLKTQQDVFEGMLKQFNREIIVLQSGLGDLDEVVHGNPRQGVRGLIDQVTEINSQLVSAQKTREALINQIRGARWALLVLAVVSGIQSLEWLNSVLKLMP